MGRLGLRPPPPAADSVGSNGGAATRLLRGGRGLECLASLSSENLPEALQLCPEPILPEAGKNSSEGVLEGRGEGSARQSIRCLSMCTLEIFFLTAVYMP